MYLWVICLILPNFYEKLFDIFSCHACMYPLMMMFASPKTMVNRYNVLLGLKLEHAGK